MLDSRVAIEPEVLRDQFGELVRLRVEQLRHCAAVLAEEALELLHQPLFDRPGAVREGTFRVRGGALELVADGLHLGPGRLTVQHPGADPQCVGDRLIGADLALEAALDQLDQRTVRDGEPVDEDLLAAGLDHRAASKAFLDCLKIAHSFHVEQHKVFLTPDGT